MAGAVLQGYQLLYVSYNECIVGNDGILVRSASACALSV